LSSFVNTTILSTTPDIEAGTMLLRTPTDLGLLIRDARRTQRLSQQELARRVGVSRQWIVEVEKGRPRAELGLVLRTLAALGLQLTVGAPRDDEPALPEATVDLDAVIAQARVPR
jgi:HTH-type transcriptional regulator/antitoxin HipB